MSRTPPVYNAKEKIWSGPAIDQRRFDFPFGEMMLNELARNGDKLIQINHDTGERMTCKEMRLKSLKVAEHLEKIGIQRGNHVSIIAHHRSNIAPFYIGVIAYGAVINFLYVNSTAPEMSYLFEIVQPQLIICDGEIISKVKKSLENLSIDPKIYAFSNYNDDVRSTEEFFTNYDTEPSTFQLPQIDDLNKTTAIILPTSGSTGLPKCVLVSHAMALSVSSLVADDGVLRYYAVSPHGGLSTSEISAAILFRSPRIITAQALTIDLVLEVLKQHDVNVLFTLPFNAAILAKRMLAEGYDLTKLTTILSGGSSVSEVTRYNFSKTLPNVEIGHQYGMTEVGIMSCSNATTKNDSVGYLVAGLSAKIVSEDGKDLSSGEIGEIYVRRSCPFLGYLKNEEATNETIDADGWLHTGDVGYFNTDGELFVVDRKKMLIKYKAHQVPPSLLEEFVRKQFDVQDIVVVGVPAEDDIGQLPAAVVVLPPKSSITEDNIIKAIEVNFSEYKHLRGGVYFVKSLPRTGNGKLQRFEVQQMANKLYGLSRLHNKAA